MTLDPLVLLVAAFAAGALYLLARWRGWKLPGWAYGAVAGAVALVGLARRRGPPPEPPRGPDVEPVRVTAADVLARREAEQRTRIEAAVAGPTPEEDVAGLADARRRR